MKPFAESSEQNKAPILAVLKTEFAHCHRILEVGSGTGQHAVFFAEQLPHLHWVCSDLQENHEGIQAWLDEATVHNIEAPCCWMPVRIGLRYRPMPSSVRTPYTSCHGLPFRA